MLKLLTSKDPVYPKRIIDQNPVVPKQASHVLFRTYWITHTVIFPNDLTVLITELGRELDFDNLSRGERNRLILSLSFAFPDVWENLYPSLTYCPIHELVDSGMDSSGVENSPVIQKSAENVKSPCGLFHRDEPLVG